MFKVVFTDTEHRMIIQLSKNFGMLLKLNGGARNTLSEAVKVIKLGTDYLNCQFDGASTTYQECFCYTELSWSL